MKRFLGSNWVLIETNPNFSIWESRLKEETWKLREAIDWVSDYNDWSVACISEQHIPKDIEAYKNNIYDVVLSEIADKKIQGRYDAHHQDYWVFVAQFLALLQCKGYMLPIPCRGYLHEQGKG